MQRDREGHQHRTIAVEIVMVLGLCSCGVMWRGVAWRGVAWRMWSWAVVPIAWTWKIWSKIPNFALPGGQWRGGRASEIGTARGQTCAFTHLPIGAQSA
jgi:hypothetical protein